MTIPKLLPVADNVERLVTGTLNGIFAGNDRMQHSKRCSGDVFEKFQMKIELGNLENLFLESH